MTTNTVIVGAILLQRLVAQASQFAAAIFGFLITSGILLWGLVAYAGGDYISLFGIRLSEPVFIGVCAIWYIVDAVQLTDARKQEAEPVAQ